MRGCGRSGRPIARRITASGRAGAGPRSPPRSRRSPAGSPPSGSGAATSSRSSATTGRGSIGRSPRRRPWAACRCPIYQDSIADEMAFVLDHAEVRFAVAEDQEQVDKLAEIKERCPLLEKVIFSDPRGMRHYDQPWLDDYAKVQERGRELARQRAGVFPRRNRQGAGQRHRDHPLHLGDDGAAQGRRPQLRQHHHYGEERDRVRRPDRSRGGAGLSADGVDRRAHLFLCAGLLRRAFAPPARNRRRRSCSICASSGRPISLRRRGFSRPS